ncbi:unnamed protein product, partial [Onchocerca ochengi]|uniref:Zf-AD domain-containing protein n=1 Tax=Onchocerca ochengi TaxID=42157 RepID=A0A182ESC0_ONCOC
IHQCLKCKTSIDPLDDDGELLFKIVPLLENLKNFDFTNDLKDEYFLKVTTDLLLPVKERDVVVMEDNNKSDDINIKIDDSVNIGEEEADLTGSDNVTRKLGESYGSTSEALQKFDNLTINSTNLQVESGGNDSMSNSSKSSRNVSFLSPVADFQSPKTFAVENEAKSAGSG